MSRFSFAARITISEANSIPVVRRSSAREHVAAQRAHAAVGVVDAGAEEEVEHAGQDRVADVAVQPRHRARLDVVHPVADHEVGAVLAARATKRGIVVEVVGEVGVGHHDVLAAARRRSRRGRRCRSRAAARARRGRRPRAASSALSSSEPLSATITSPSRPAVSSASRAAATHCSMFSASLRHGITTDTRTPSGAGARRPGEAGVCWSVLMAAAAGGSLPHSNARRRWKSRPRAARPRVARRW